jgi:hypothetical protein
VHLHDDDLPDGAVVADLIAQPGKVARVEAMGGTLSLVEEFIHATVPTRLCVRPSTRRDGREIDPESQGRLVSRFGRVSSPNPTRSRCVS